MLSYSENNKLRLFLRPEIEILYPPDVPFSTGDLSAICFNRYSVP